MTITPDRPGVAKGRSPAPRLHASDLDTPPVELGWPAGDGSAHATGLSGLYAYRRPTVWPSPADDAPAAPDGRPWAGRPGLPSVPPFAPAAPVPLHWPLRLSAERLRLDVDGPLPQMAASGTIHRGPTSRVHWIASLVATGPCSWRGTIWHKDGDVATLPHTDVSITVAARPSSTQQQATVTFAGGGARRVVSLQHVSPYFHDVDLEFDATADATPVTSIRTDEHANRPPTLPGEDLSIETVLRRTGFDVRTSTGSDSIVPLAVASVNAGPRWSDSEVHDAMQLYWSRFSSAAPWAIWVLWARQHEAGAGLGGLVFDDLGPGRRAATAVFTDSFIATPPAGDPNPAAWVDRMALCAAVHGIGHAFDLAHSWQKVHPPERGSSWMPLANDPEARSFMNHPGKVAGQEAAFFRDFDYRFIDPELLLMRHAPDRSPDLGHAGWFERDGLDASPDGPPSPLRLTVRATRDKATFDFLEPVILELRLTNTGPRPLVVDGHVLASDGVIAVLRQRGRPARRWVPYARYCREPDVTVLAPGQSLYESLPLYAGRNGWDISDPGVYQVHVALDLDEQPIVSRPLTVKVRPPSARVEEHLAQDLFSDEAGRALAVGGTVVMCSAVSALESIVEEAPDTRAALHAEAALASPFTIPYKVLHLPVGGGRPTSASLAGAEVRTRPARPDEAAERLQAVLVSPGSTAAETFGHIGYRRRVEALGRFLDRAGDPSAAAQTMRALREVLEARGVLPTVVEEVGRQERLYERRARGESNGQV